MKKYLIAILFFALFLGVNAQHGISPGYSFMDAKNKQVKITIFNQSDEEKEADILLKFGYPIYDDTLGKTEMFYGDSLNAPKYSLNSRVKIFPKKVILPAKSQQTVKLVFSGDTEGLEDGTLWTRISVKSLMKKAQIDTSQKDGISVGMDIVYETTTILMYQKGELTTGIELGDVEVREDSLSYYLVIVTKKTGNSPYLGLYELNIKDSEGSALPVMNGGYTIYFDAKPGIRILKKDIKAGTYTAELKINNDRPDLDKERKIATEPIVKNFTFSIK